MIRQCIIIIDPQKDFTSEDGAYILRHPSITRIKEATRQIQLLLDRATGDTIVVYSNYGKEQFGEGLNMCIPGTKGHEPGILISPQTSILSKQLHSAFSDPLFRQFIKDNEYEHLIIGGFLAEYCVRQTALDALLTGYRVSLLRHCIASSDDVQHKVEQTLLELQQHGAVIIE